MRLCFYVIRAFLLSVPGLARNADPLINTEPGCDRYQILVLLLLLGSRLVVSSLGENGVLCGQYDGRGP